MRPRFTIKSLLILTAFAALGAHIYLNHMHVLELETEYRARVKELEQVIALHQAVRTQARLVKRRELELHAAKQEMKPLLATLGAYRFVGGGDDVTPDVVESEADRVNRYWQFVPSIGFRSAAAKVRHAKLVLARERAVLVQFEHDLKKSTNN